jgi:hypothetical protein
MSEQIIETHRCNCGEGNIYVKKSNSYRNGS